MKPVHCVRDCQGRVCTLLIDLQPQDLQSPLGDFQSTRLDKEDMWRLIKTIDEADPDNELPEKLLRKAFDQRWSDFNEKSEKIRREHRTVTKAPERDQSEMIGEVLEIARAIRRALERAESKEPIVFPALSGVTPPGFSGYS